MVKLYWTNGISSSKAIAVFPNQPSCYVPGGLPCRKQKELVVLIVFRPMQIINFNDDVFITNKFGV